MVRRIEKIISFALLAVLGVIAIGGDHFTNDLAVSLRTPIPDAEKLKQRAGCAFAALVDEEDMVEVPSIGKPVDPNTRPPSSRTGGWRFCAVQIVGG